MELDTEKYKNSSIPFKYWDQIANFLSCCEAELEKISDNDYLNLRWNEQKICFQALLYNLDIPEELHKKITCELCCPECSRKIKLDSYVSINYSYLSNRNKKKLESYINRKTKKDIKFFIDYLKKYPFLGMENKIGKKIKKEISELRTTVLKNEIWFRARNPDKENPNKIFSTNDMSCPPLQKAREGRFNHNGQSALYLGNSEICCAKEINEGNFYTICWIQKVKVKEAKVFDFTIYEQYENLKNCPLTVAGLIITGELENHDRQHKEYFKPEYAITQFIADLCRYYKIDGIKYKSAVSNKNSINLVLFENNATQLYEFIDSPKLYNASEYTIRSKMGNTEIVFYGE